MYYVVVNPAAKTGKGKSIWESIEPIFAQMNQKYKVVFTKKAGHTITLVREICNRELLSDRESILKLIILGGDGTLNEAIQGVTDFKRVQIGYVPTGSSNDFARDMGYPSDPKECLRNILNCKSPIYKDLGYLVYDATSGELSRSHEENLITRRLFNVSSGIGYDAAICEEALTAPAKKVLNRIGLGKLIYLVVALKQLFGTKRCDAVMTLDDNQEIKLDSFLFTAAMIHRYEGGGFMFCPEADCRDGLLDICAISKVSNLTILRALPKALKGKHFCYEGVNNYRAKKIHIETTAPLWVHTDGEVSMKSTSITITCEKETMMLLK